MDGRERTRWLAVTIVVAVLALAGTTTALLLFDPRSTGANALRTGGLAAGAVVALYGLWLNDRRRRVEEHRQDVERRNTDLERDRIADERFARAVELLGSEADQVRVGALHALAGLARNRSDYTQTVLDVLCSYLRRPFAHPRYQPETATVAADRGEHASWNSQAPPAFPDGSDTEEPSWTVPAIADAERKLEVRLTAQRLIADLLPAVGKTDAPAYDLDLTGASLQYFDISGSRVGTLTLRYARLYSSTNFSDCEFIGPAWFTGSATGTGNTRCQGTVFHERAWFSGVRFANLLFDRTRVLGPAKFSGSEFAGPVSMVDTVFHGKADLRDASFRELDLDSATFEGEVLGG